MRNAIQNLADAVNNLAKTIADSGTIQLSTTATAINAIKADLQPVSEATQEEMDLPYFEDIMEGLTKGEWIFSEEDEFGNVTATPAMAAISTAVVIETVTPGLATRIGDFLPAQPGDVDLPPIEFQVGFAGPAEDPQYGEGPYEVKF